MPDKTFEFTGLRVRFQDVDHAGIVFFAKFYEYCHVAYEEFVEDILGLPPQEFFDVRRFASPLVATGSSHFHPLRHGDRLTVRVWVKAVGRTSMTMCYEIDTKDQRRCAAVWTKHVFVDGKTMTSIPIPESIRAVLTDYVPANQEEDLS